MTLMLDRYFVHRLRMVTGKDGNPLNEVELIEGNVARRPPTLAVGLAYQTSW
jgi:hypothetical protein